jgi:hypothetical protein
VGRADRESMAVGNFPSSFVSSTVVYRCVHDPTNKLGSVELENSAALVSCLRGRTPS